MMEQVYNKEYITNLVWGPPGWIFPEESLLGHSLPWNASFPK